MRPCWSNVILEISVGPCAGGTAEFDHWVGAEQAVGLSALRWRKETAKQIVLTCRCEEGFWPFNVGMLARGILSFQIKPGLHLQGIQRAWPKDLEAAPD